MIAFKHLIWKAATVAATDPRVRRQAARVYKAQVEPRAKDAWVRAKPKLQQTTEQLRDAAKQTHPIRHPMEFAAKAGKALRSGPRPDDHDR